MTTTLEKAASTRYVISQPLLAGLAGLLPGEKSPFSPLHIANPPQLTPEQKLLLENAEILIGGNVLSEPARLVLTSLSEIVSFAHVRLSTPAGTFDQTVQFTPGGQQSVAIANTDDGMVLLSPADSEAALTELRDLIGASQRSPAAWSVRLTPPEMQVLTALMDLRRRAVLRSLADQQPVIPPPSDPSAIAAAIQAMSGNPLWLTAAVQTATGQPAALNAAQVQAALAALVDKKLTGQHGSSFYPVHEAIQVADRFLLLNTYLSLDAGSSNSQGRSTSARQAWLGAGTGELLHMAPALSSPTGGRSGGVAPALSSPAGGRSGGVVAEQDLLLEVAAPAAALEQIRTFFTHFDALPAPALEVVPLAVIIQNGINAGKVFNLGEETVLGRSEQADVHLLDSRASRRHSVIRRLNEGYLLNDAGSTNGTLLNNHPVTTPTPLAEGDIILIGETELKVMPAGAVPPPPLLESTPTVYVGEAMRLSGETPPLPPPPVGLPVSAEKKSQPAVPPDPPPPAVVKLQPVAPPNPVSVPPAAPAPGVEKLQPNAPPSERWLPPIPAPTPAMPPAPPPVPPAPAVVKLQPTAQPFPPLVPAEPPAPGVVKLQPAASPIPAPVPAIPPTPPEPGVIKLQPAAQPFPPLVPAEPPAPGVVKLQPAAPSPTAAPVPSSPRASETPETPPRWFVPPPPPVKPGPVIPPPPAMSPAPFEAPPSGVPERPATTKPAQCARCREPMNPSDLVCTHCGQPVGQPVVSTAPVLPQTMAVCPQCFSPFEYGTRFCGTCGHKLT